MNEKSTKIIIYSILNENCRQTIDSPPLEVFNSIQLYNILKTLKFASPFVFIEPIGLLNRGTKLTLDELLVKNSMLLFHYSSFHRNRGLKNNIIERLIEKSKGVKDIYFLDLYNGAFSYIEYDEKELIKLYPQINRVFRYSHIPFTNKSFNELYNGLPFIEDLDINKIFKYLKRAIKKDLVKDITAIENIFPYKISSGCNYKCTFCSGEKERFRHISLEQINRDLSLLKTYGLERLILVDQYPNYDVKFFSDFLDVVNTLNIKIHFANGIGLLHINDRIATKLKRCVDYIYLSPESGSDKILKLLNKPFRLSIIEDRLNLLKRHRIKAKLHIIYDVPGEKKRDAIGSFTKIGEWIQKYDVDIHIQKFVPVANLFASSKNTKDINSYFYEESSARYYPPLLKYAQLQRDKRVERKLIINVSYRCNNNCIFCSIGDRERVDGDIDFQIKYLTEYYNKGFRLLDIDGGEPFLYRHLFILLNKAYELGYERINITTNGRMLVYEKLINKLHMYDNLNILVSIHSVREGIQCRLTNSKESLAQTMKGIRNVVNIFGVNRIGINTTLTSVNYKYINEIVEFIGSSGIKTFNLQYYTPFGKVKPSLKPPNDTAKYLNDIVILCKKNNIDLRLVNFEYCIAPHLAEYMYEDFYKVERYMLFVNNTIVNLSNYLSQKRKYKRDCLFCEFRLLCKGHWIYE